MKVLILTGKFGMGHYSVANSLSAQIKKESVDANVMIVDMLNYIMPACSKAIYESFHVLVNYGSGLYNAFYNYSEKTRLDVKMPLMDLFALKLAKLMKETNPDVIISTLPLCSQVAAEYKKHYHCQTPLITCITDISSHPEWLCPGTALYLVASEWLKNKLVLRGVQAERIHVTGIPIKAEFKEYAPLESSSHRQILIMGGGLGLLPKSASFYEAINALENIKTTVITGNNKRLYKRLHGKYGNIEVIGYTDKVYEYMHNADLVISKPGGITLYETIFAELPILAFKPFLQQEVNNSKFILNHNIGQVLPRSSKDCITQITNLIHDEHALNAIKANMHTLKSELNHDEIMDIIGPIACKPQQPFTQTRTAKITLAAEGECA